MTDELITLEAIEAKQNELASLIAKFKRQPAAGPVLHKFGEIEIELRALREKRAQGARIKDLMRLTGRSRECVDKAVNGRGCYGGIV